MIRYLAILVLFLPLSSFAELLQDLQNLSLARAIQIAAQHNHELRSSALALDSANAAATSATAAPNPMLTVQTTGINPGAGIGAGGLRDKSLDSVVRIDQLIERGGKRELRKENAQHLAEAASDDLSDARRLLRVNVANAYYDLLASQEKLLVLRQTAALYDGTVAAAQLRFKAGDIASADVARLQVDALRAWNDTLQAEADHDNARVALAQALGLVSHAQQITLADDSWPVPQFNAAQPLRESVALRPDVRAAQRRLDAALAGRRLAQAARTRDVSVGVQYEHFPSSAANPQGSGNSYGLALQVPLFVRYRYDGEIRAAEAAVDAARENLDKTRDRAFGDALTSWQNARASFARVQCYDDNLLDAAKKSAAAAEFAFKNGALGVMDVLDARRTYRAIQLDALTVRTNYAKSLAAWQAATSESETQ